MPKITTHVSKKTKFNVEPHDLAVDITQQWDPSDIGRLVASLISELGCSHKEDDVLSYLKLHGYSGQLSEWAERSKNAW